ncbi:hypothetical protein [Clostridium tarantellae]|uniref:DUF4064 domain-containing protein n=1 Tax=Clostridium tarantellae TaxID=39493 RepID=A0A6I1MJT3_9CLOT|nr:hypothetical protein [Clostridium tarantellae]MPQ42422.1 hypothetical protein [Clostridium tarantellae]
MEDCKNKKLGAGILTVSIIQLVFSILAVLFFAFLLIALNSDTIVPNEVKEIYLQNGITITTLSISLIFIILSIVAIIFILCKKAIGIYIYFITIVVNYIYSLIMSGFSFLGLIGLILPLLMAIFIYRRRYVFNIGVKCAND